MWRYSPARFPSRFGLGLFVMLLTGALPAAAQGPESVLLVVNGRSQLSKAIADYYQQKRHIPADNVCTIQTSPDAEDISRSDYDLQIAAPIANCLREKNLVEQIRYIVTTGGTPLRIPTTRGEGMDVDGAAVDSELTYLYSDITKKQLHPAKGALRNPFYQRRTAPFSHQAFPMYMVTRLAGYSLADVKAMIDHSLAAKNQGTFVIDGAAFADKQGEEWLATAALRLPKDRRLYDQNVKPVYGEKNVIALASWGSNDKAREERFVNFQWLPGAVVTEYVSSNGRTFKKPPDDWTLGTWDDSKTWFGGSPQSLTADYIAEGASAATGHVAEPFLGTTPRPDFLLPAYYSGRNLAESFYVSIPALSWQNIVIGDPLMSLGKP